MTPEMEKSTRFYRESFERFEKSLNGSSHLPVHALRRDAISFFAQKGFPTTREEEWRFTNLASLARTDFAPVLSLGTYPLTRELVDHYSFGSDAPIRLVFVDGHFVPAFSALAGLPPGVTAGSLAGALTTDSELLQRHIGRYARSQDGAFTALNTAFLQDGACILLPDDTDVEEALHLLFFSSGAEAPFLSSPRNLIVVGNRSKVSVVESYVGTAANTYLTNVVTEFVVGEEAVIEHDKLQIESTRAYHIGTTCFYQSARSNVTSNSIAVGGTLVRNTVTAILAEGRSICTLNGLSLSTGSQLIDNHTAIDHASPECESHELYKSILDGDSRGVFSGKIVVRKDAQKTDAKQTNKTLVLSDGATINTKPQLEIFADDVKCTHGATVGQLDDDQLFYLRARGIDEVAARDILTFAFASDVIGRVHVDPLRAQLDSLLRTRLRQGRVADFEG
jgi:Fe-S cluster assembly protein SufD